MALLKEWQKVAYDETKDRGTLQRFWANYFNLEKGVYEKLLEEPDVEVKGTVKELAEKYGLSIMEMTGFLDGINESLVEANPIEEMEEDTVVSLKFDKEMQKLTGCMSFRSGTRSSIKRRNMNCIWSRRSLVPS